MKTRLIVIGPLPPPYHGVAVSTSLVLANPLLHEHFDIEHLNTTDPRPISNLGKWDAMNVFLALRSVLALAVRLRGRPGVVYFPLSESKGGFVRDSLFINLAAARGWKAAAHIRNSLFRTFYDSQGKIFRMWIRFTLRRVAAVAVLGESLRRLFDGLVSRKRISVVPNGTPDFERGSLEPNPQRVLYLSNLARKKGADLAVRAALLTLTQNPRVEFVFAGEWEDEKFETEVRSLDSDKNGRIIFLPPVEGDAKRELMASAWVLLFPVAWGEGHPRIVLEALAAGVPIVTTDRATISETVGDGEAGFVLPDPVPKDIADRILVLLADPVLRERMSKAARARYLERFTQERADRRLAEWLGETAEKSSHD